MTAETGPEPPGSTYPSRGFVAYWTSVGISQFGSAMSLVAIPLVAAVSLGASPGQMSVVATAGMLPSLLIGVPAATWSDSLRERLPVMVSCALVQAVIMTAVPVLWLLDLLTIASLAALVAAASLARGVYTTLANPLLVQLVPRPDLVDATGSSVPPAEQRTSAVPRSVVR